MESEHRLEREEVRGLSHGSLKTCRQRREGVSLIAIKQ